ncbi:MAG: hypothetical protein VW729_06860 [Deltaproteobacteria bacterium]
MKKFYLCKLCLIVFGALLAVQSIKASEQYHGHYLCLPIESGGLTFYSGSNGKQGEWQSGLHPYTRLNMDYKFTVMVGETRSYYKFVGSDNEYEFDPELKGSNMFKNPDYVFRSFSDAGLFEFNAERRHYVFSRSSGLITSPLESEYSNLPEPLIQLGKCSKL